MFVKNKIINKIIEIYLGAFVFFSLISVNIVINDILRYCGIENNIISYLVFIITISTYIGLAVAISNEKNNNSEM